MPSMNLGQSEWEILRYVAEHHPVTVREVAEHVAVEKGHARTTVLTVMERLRAKHYLVRRKHDGVYQYSPKKSATDLTHGLIQTFVDRMLNGTLSPFFAYLSRADNLSDDQLHELRAIVKDLEAKRGEDGK